MKNKITATLTDKESRGIKSKLWIPITAALVLIATLLTVLILYLRPIQSIVITNDDLKYGESMGIYKVVYFDENNFAQYQIEYEVSPSFLKNRDVKFEYDEAEGVKVDKNGLVTFTSAPFNEGTVNSIKVDLVPKNGRGYAKSSITIVAKK